MKNPIAEDLIAIAARTLRDASAVSIMMCEVAAEIESGVWYESNDVIADKIESRLHDSIPAGTRSVIASIRDGSAFDSYTM